MPDELTKWERFSRPWAGLTGHAQPGQRRWGVGVGAVLISLLAVRLGVPRAVPPGEVPLPRLGAEAGSIGDAERRLDAASGTPLPSSVRAVGEFVRRVGLAEAKRDPDETRYERGLLQQQVRRVLDAGGADDLLELREVQTALFIQALARWDGSETTPKELRELGGGFVAHLGPGPGVGRIETTELEAAYRTRWTALLELEEHVRFVPTLNDYRAAARLKLRLADRLPPAERLQVQRRIIEQISRLDATYPAQYALGVALYLAGDYSESLLAFREHSRVHPDGEWTLRARNYQLAAASAVLGDVRE